MHKKNGLDFSKITTFNLDEYICLPPDHDQNYYHFMNENLFKHINININNVHLPQGIYGEIKIGRSGTDPKIEECCRWYEERVKSFGGLDLQILGIDSNGHNAFNEPGSSLSVTAG